MERDIALHLLKDNLIRALDRMKKLANKGRTERQFEERDMVFLSLQPYRQVSMGGRRPQKLSPLFFGPYKVLQRVGTVSYRLEQPKEARIHNVFHVSQLKKQLGRNVQVQHQVPSHSVKQNLKPE